MFQLYLDYEHRLAELQLVLFMFGMGVTLSPRDFAPIVQQPALLIIGLSCVLIISPFVALGFNQIAPIGEGIAVGLLLVAALPGGTLSNVFTYISRGNVPLSIALSAIGTIVSIITLPLILDLLAGQYMPAEFEMPVWEMIGEIFFCVMVPLALGMTIGRWVPDHRLLIARCAVRTGFALVILMVIGSLGSGRIHLASYGFAAVLSIILFCLLLQQVIVLPFRFNGTTPGDFAAVGIEVTIRNVYLGLLLATLFPVHIDSTLADGPQSISLRDDMMFVVLLYGAVSLFVGFPLALRIRRVIKHRERTLATAEMGLPQ